MQHSSETSPRNRCDSPSSISRWRSTGGLIADLRAVTGRPVRWFRLVRPYEDAVARGDSARAREIEAGTDAWDQRAERAMLEWYPAAAP